MPVLEHPGRADASTTPESHADRSPLSNWALAYPVYDPTAGLGPAAPDNDDLFALDMRVVESTTPLVVMMCSTSDGCGSSCSTSACATKSSDPT
ncbi:FxLD family lanthipeptide [Hamadaea tsunoensis]|uniref:FxLD family lanthipeptide n=1 Tax=Hamadaea tsunoensis TaxID=53368 RepID=UPI000A02E3E7|nr:FxLD family lanthipeptide [Hamadaea tsunoensis]